MSKATMASPASTAARPKPHLLFGTRRSANSSITCCSFKSEDGAAVPVIDPDWRSFRAQLYFNEQSSSAKKIGDKWAHPLVEPEKGCLLIATEKLDGSHIFERTVILLLSAGVRAPVGVILNRPSLMSIKEAAGSIFADDADIAGAFSGRPLFFGGPLEECFFILGPRRTAATGGDVVARTGLFEEVMPGVHYGTRETVGCAAELAKRGVSFFSSPAPPPPYSPRAAASSSLASPRRRLPLPRAALLSPPVHLASLRRRRNTLPPSATIPSPGFLALLRAPAPPRADADLTVGCRRLGPTSPLPWFNSRPGFNSAAWVPLPRHRAPLRRSRMPPPGSHIAAALVQRLHR
nr:unnamed protein product [Digitaria exilis]